MEETEFVISILEEDNRFYDKTMVDVSLDDLDLTRCLEEELNERQDIEFKDERADNTKLAKEIVAFANADGGVLFLGVRESDGTIEEIQDVSDYSEREEGVNNTISAQVVPPLTIDWEAIEYQGSTVLAFRVPNSSRIHSFEENGKPVHPVRQGSVTRYMDSWELRENLGGRQFPSTPHNGSVNSGDTNGEDSESEYDRTMNPEWTKGTFRTGTTDIDPSPSVSVPEYSSPEGRFVAETAGRTIIVPGMPTLDPLHFDSLTFHVEDSIPITSAKEVKQTFQKAEKMLDVGAHLDLAYTISLGRREWIGYHLENLLEDMRNIGEVTEVLQPGSGSPSDPRPIGVIVASCSRGLFWMQFQWRKGQLRPTRTKCGLILPDLPLNLQQIREFFDTIGGDPQVFEQDSRLQFLTVYGRSKEELQNPRSTQLKTQLSRPYREVIADNPFYQQGEKFGDAFDTNIPDHYNSAVSSINRLPFDVAAGWSPDDEGFTFDMLQVFGKHLLHPTYFVFSHCGPKHEY